MLYFHVNNSRHKNGVEVQYLQGRVKKELSFKLTNEQLLAVKELMQGNDVLAILPTGFGKSRIYQAFTSLKNTDTNQRALVLVITPLDSLLEDQLIELKILIISPRTLQIYQ